MNYKTLLSAILIFTLGGAMTACNRQPSAAIQPAMTSAESYKVSGDYEMHYNAVRTDQLGADIARAYGIERSKNKVLLNISVLHKATGSNVTTPSDAAISVIVRNLNNQLQDIQLRRIAEATATYYIGEVSFSGNDTLVFEIKATPSGASIPIEAKLTREFFAN